MTGPSPVPFSIGSLARELAVGLIVRGLLFSFLGGTSFVIVGLLIGIYVFQGSGATVFSVALLYGVLGAILGYALALAGMAKRVVEKIEPELHRTLAPRINGFVAAIPFGSGISFAQFQRELDSKLGAELRTAERTESGLGSRLSGFVMRRVAGAIRAVFLKDFGTYLETRGEKTVTTENASGFVREKLVGLVVANAEQQIGGMRTGAFAIGAILCIGPPIVAAFI